MRNVVAERDWKRAAVELIELERSKNLSHRATSAGDVEVNAGGVADLVRGFDEGSSDDLAGRPQVDTKACAFDQAPVGIGLQKGCLPLQTKRSFDVRLQPQRAERLRVELSLRKQYQY